jgi:hypothetical protein
MRTIPKIINDKSMLYILQIKETVGFLFLLCLYLPLKGNLRLRRPLGADRWTL